MQHLLTLALYILIGYFAGSSGIFSKNFPKLLSRLEVFIFLPAYVLNILVHLWKLALPALLTGCISETAGCMIPIAMIWGGFFIHHFLKE